VVVPRAAVAAVCRVVIIKENRLRAGDDIRRYREEKRGGVRRRGIKRFAEEEEQRTKGIRRTRPRGNEEI